MQTIQNLINRRSNGKEKFRNAKDLAVAALKNVLDLGAVLQALKYNFI